MPVLDLFLINCKSCSWKISSSNLDSFSEADKLKYYQNGQTKQASQPATGHPEAVGAAGSSVGVAEAIEAVEVLELLGGHEDEATTHPIESILHSLDIIQIINHTVLE